MFWIVAGWMFVAFVAMFTWWVLYVPRVDRSSNSKENQLADRVLAENEADILAEQCRQILSIPGWKFSPGIRETLLDWAEENVNKIINLTDYDYALIDEFQGVRRDWRTGKYYEEKMQSRMTGDVLDGDNIRDSEWAPSPYYSGDWTSRCQRVIKR